MSVPLDRLYNFLHDVCNHHDIIIYRFFPHGSRKLSDLLLLSQHSKRVQYQNSRRVIFYDQEPLNYNAYGSQEVAREFIKHSNIVPKVSGDNADEKLNNFYSKLNLRMVLHPLTYSSKPVLLVHSEKNSADLECYEKIGMVGVYWWCHALIARDWFRHAEHDPILDCRAPNLDFLIYNRAWTGTREYRLKFAELLVTNQLVTHCNTKFAPIDSDNYYLDHVFKNKDFEIQITDLEKIFNPNTVEASASADYVSEDYSHTQLEVVLETLFDDDRIQLTEKILRPIACGHPFMLVSTKGSLKYLQGYGFETYGKYINETYDNISDPLERLEAVVSEMKRISNLPAEEKQQLYANLRDISARNKQLFFSKSWHDFIVQEYKDNFESALEVTKKFKIDFSDLQGIF